MACPLRIESPGTLYHLTTRGNARQDIFLEEEDRQRLLGLLAHAVFRFHFLLHASCLMDNHFHLVLERPEADPSNAMRQLMVSRATVCPKLVESWACTIRRSGAS
jgi:REP element-mobilizing transposase RayT